MAIRFKLYILVFLFTCASGGACSARASSDADAHAGAVLFRDKGCAHCHGADGSGTAKGPSLLDIRNNKDWPPEKMSDQILNGGTKMPSFRDSLSDEEIGQLVTYLRAKYPLVPPPSPDSPVPAAPAPRE